MSTTRITCPTCGLTQRLTPLPPHSVADCVRCGARLAKSHNALTRTAALSIAALLLYVPANIYPVMRVDLYGLYRESTVWSGCVQLFEDGQWPIALIVFLASMVVPLLKLLGLFFLVVSVKMKLPRFRSLRTRVFRMIEVIGPWAMLDVFLLAILVALVKLGRIATVTPGPGIVAFTAVVVLTLFASASFDPKQIWNERELHEREDAST
jgi:paraquat-inducible protein A